MLAFWVRITATCYCQVVVVVMADERYAGELHQPVGGEGDLFRGGDVEC